MGQGQIGRREGRARYARRSVAVLAFALLVLTSCREPVPQAPPSPPAQGRGAPAARIPPAPPPAGSRALKDPGAGLYLKDRLPPDGMRFLDHVVVQGDWSEFEPRDQQFTGPGWDRVEEALADPDLKVRLRIQAGRGSPAFVKSQGGPARSGDGVDCSEEGGIAIAKGRTTTDGLAKEASSGCVPYFWTDAFLHQYEQLMTEVSRRYESNPRLLDVVDSACMTFFAEPFIRAGRSGSTNARLFEAGLNEQTDEACHRRSLEIHDRLFPTTRVSLATHSVWQIVGDPETNRNGVTLSWDRQRELLEDLRSRYGGKLVVQNNGLGGGEGCRAGGQGSGTHFCWLASAAPPKGFQTEGGTRLESRGFTELDAVEQAIEMGACFVEHNRFRGDPKQVERYDERLRENCSGRPSG
ncbi:MAG TPA: hypothetical protein VHJ78_02845 [Actinomycetota bacterium]|nr:hypothetical protein [Actinomycetota bacterium]